ncbi:TetR/AcrR family transcriptional regulator [Thalassococcus sp. S3]|uniref:TetR/AcrR family transcriptional regulator n=1 Tax=Thalassococcus sp. S3 TaxID=2017482 RepID=UPI0010249272|nr:TetR/AcrR family transcriptional regulator [Thalassococcus sp. S3]QBF33665.1 hypothetical protein CFI11_20960 [Thalassococcus sp. S3]
MEDIALPDIEMRKLPLQDRSRARLEAIQEAATSIILEQGLPKMGIREVARRAEVNIATFYQFFPNKTSLLRQLSETYMIEIRELVQNAGQRAMAMSIEDGVEHICTGMLDYFRANPAYIELWSGGQANPELRDVNLDDSYQNAKFLELLGRHWSGGREVKGLETLTLLLSITTGHVLRHAALMSKEDGDALVKAHCEMVTAKLRVALLGHTV